MPTISSSATGGSWPQFAFGEGYGYTTFEYSKRRLSGKEMSVAARHAPEGLGRGHQHRQPSRQGDGAALLARHRFGLRAAAAGTSRLPADWSLPPARAGRSPSRSRRTRLRNTAPTSAKGRCPVRTPIRSSSSSPAMPERRTGCFASAKAFSPSPSSRRRLAPHRIGGGRSDESWKAGGNPAPFSKPTVKPTAYHPARQARHAGRLSNSYGRHW